MQNLTSFANASANVASLSSKSHPLSQRNNKREKKKRKRTSMKINRKPKRVLLKIN